MDVLDALEATAGIAEQQATRPDGLLLELAHMAGVDARSIELRPYPRKGNHGHHTVTWLQDDRQHHTEGSTLEVALRRAVRQASTVSAHSSSGEATE